MLAAALAVVVAAFNAPGPAVAAPSSASVAAAQTAADQAVARYAAAQQRMAVVDAKLDRNSAKLDKLVARQEKLQGLLGARVGRMYRHGHVGFVAVLTRSVTFEQFASAWSMFARVGRQDALAIAELKATRAKTASAAQELIQQQAALSKRLRDLDRSKAAAKRDLSASQAAYASYRARIAALEAQRVAKAAARAAARTAARPAPRPQPASYSAPKKASAPARSGSGGWSTGGASHYGSGSWGRRTADGTRIGPDSMIVAHKTLPFGTLVEFEFRGRTAVARVADRGPYVRGRDWDLGPGVIRILGFNGVHQVRYRVIGR